MSKSTKSLKDDDIKGRVNEIIKKVLGGSDSAVAAVILSCISAGFDRRKIADKLSSLLDSEKRAKLADRVSELPYAVNRNGNKPIISKRAPEDETDSRKRSKEESGVLKEIRPQVMTTISPIDIQNMMANAQRDLEKRKKALDLRSAAPAVESAADADDRKKKIQFLQAQIQSKIASGIMKGIPIIKPTADKPAPLILNSEGRTIDLAGREVQLTHVVPTLKANIRARKREVFSQPSHSSSKSSEESAESRFIDPRIPTKAVIRSKRALKFHEPGKFQKIAHSLRTKAKLEKLQSEISQIARKTGISTAAKLAQLKPKGDDEVDEIPDIEWWDCVVVADQTYDNIHDENVKHLINDVAITHLVEHPIQMKPPTDPMKPVPLPLFLTKAEQKKLRRQNRREAWKEEQEKIRLGLIAAPEPKLRISNLMRVLGTEAVQDPTKMEAHVRAQLAKRQKAHEDANAARKLTRDQKRQKSIRKTKEDTSLGVHVAVYRVADLSSASKKFKIEKNAKQLLMTGSVIMFQDCNVIVVEGGPKQQKKFKRLMLNRIKWEEDVIKNREGEQLHNKCALVWEGMTKQRNFGEMKFKACATEKLARDQMRKHAVEHYWDLAYSKSVLETEDK